MFLYITYALLASLLTGYGSIKSADNTERDFVVQSFEQVSINDAFTVAVKAGSTYSVKATGRTEDLDNMEVSTRKGILTVQYKPVKLKKNQNQDPVINREAVNVTVTLPALRKGEFRKLSRFTIEGFSRAELVELVINTQATGLADLNTNRLKLALDGQSSVTLRGETGQLEAQLQGQSGLMAYDLKARLATVVVNGMSKAEVSATDALQATANGTSQVTYKGQPTVKASENGESTIKAFTP